MSEQDVDKWIQENAEEGIESETPSRGTDPDVQFLRKSTGDIRKTSFSRMFSSSGSTALPLDMVQHTHLAGALDSGPPSSGGILPETESYRQMRCGTCNIDFSDTSAYQLHKRCHEQSQRYMEGLLRYTCDVCGREFGRKDQYTGHVNMHSGQQPFKCRFCNRGFAYQTNCTRHEKKCYIERK